MDINITLLQGKITSILTYALQHTDRILQKIRKDDGPAPKRMRTEIEFQNNLRELEIAVVQLKKDIANLQGDVQTKDQKIAELTRQVNLGFEKEKKKKSECTCLSDICALTLEHLISHQTKNPSFEKANALEINRLTEIYKNRRGNVDSLPEMVRKESEVANTQKQSIDEEEGKKLLDLCQVKTEEGENSSLCKCKETSNLMAKINKYEEATKTKNLTKINKQWHDCIKKLDQQYSLRLKSLSMEIFQIVSASKNRKIREHYKSFQEKKKSKTEEIEQIQENSNLLLPEELKKKYEESFADAVREVQDDLDDYHRIIFNFPAAEARLKGAYEDLVLMMVQESSRLSRLEVLTATESISARNTNSVQRGKAKATSKLNAKKLLRLKQDLQNRLIQF